MSMDSDYKEAIYSEKMDRVLRLVSEGADVHLQDKLGWTALHLGAKLGDIRPFEDPRFDKVNINATSRNGLTALHYAVSKQNARIVREILKRGPDISICNNDGKNVFTLARESGAEHIQDLLNAYAVNENGYIKENDSAVSTFYFYTASGQRLTTTFDFTARKVIDTVSRGDKISACVYAFADYTDAAAISKAAEALVELGGDPGEEYQAYVNEKKRPSDMPKIRSVKTNKGVKLS